MQEASPKTPRRWRGGNEGIVGGLLVWNRQKRGFYGHHPHVPESLAVCRAVALAPRVTATRGCTPLGFWGAAAGCASRSCAGDKPPRVLFSPPAAWPRWRACCPGAWGSAPCSAPASRRPTGCWWPPKSTPCPPTSAGPLPPWHPQRTDPARGRWRRAAGHRDSPAPGTISSAPGSKYVRKLLARGRGRKISFFFPN